MGSCRALRFDVSLGLDSDYHSATISSMCFWISDDTLSPKYPGPPRFFLSSSLYITHVTPIYLWRISCDQRLLCFFTVSLPASLGLPFSQGKQLLQPLTLHYMAPSGTDQTSLIGCSRVQLGKAGTHSLLSDPEKRKRSQVGKE